MKAHIYSSDRFSSDGMIYFQCDREVLMVIKEAYEDEIAKAIGNHDYSLAEDLIHYRNNIAEKLEDESNISN